MLLSDIQLKHKIFVYVLLLWLQQNNHSSPKGQNRKIKTMRLQKRWWWITQQWIKTRNTLAGQQSFRGTKKLWQKKPVTLQLVPPHMQRSTEEHHIWFRLGSYFMAAVFAADSYSRRSFSLYLAGSARRVMVPGGSTFHLEPGTIGPHNPLWIIQSFWIE